MKINIDHYNRMYNALKTIAKGYQTPDQLRRNSKGQYGLSYHETLEMAYENIQSTARDAIRNVRRLQTKPIVVQNDERSVASKADQGTEAGKQ